MMPGYFQTWHRVVGLRRYRLAILIGPIQFLCKIISGHQLSETEWGYGGGQTFDRWCRWCNKKFSVPVAEEPNKYFLVDLFNDDAAQEEDK